MTEIGETNVEPVDQQSEFNGQESNPEPEVAKVDDDKPAGVVESSTAKKKSGFVLSDLSFEELKLEVRMMPTIVPRKGGSGCGERGRSSSEGGAGSLTERLDNANVNEKKPVTKKSTMRQQFSLNDELLSRERLQVCSIPNFVTFSLQVFLCTTGAGPTYKDF